MSPRGLKAVHRTGRASHIATMYLSHPLSLVSELRRTLSRVKKTPYVLDLTRNGNVTFNVTGSLQRTDVRQADRQSEHGCLQQNARRGCKKTASQPAISLSRRAARHHRLCFSTKADQFDAPQASFHLIAWPRLRASASTKIETKSFLVWLPGLHNRSDPGSPPSLRRRRPHTPKPRVPFSQPHPSSKSSSSH